MAFAPPPLALPIRRGFRWTAPLEWWHLLSLDAPTVAALWAWSFARAIDVSLPAASLLLLALGTWIIYVSDRILDGLHASDGERTGRLRERHFFYARQRRSFVIAGVPALLLLAWLIFHMIRAAREADTVLFTLAALYFCLVHLRGPDIERWLPKELAVGLLFAAATAVPTWTRIAGHRSSLIPVAALFAALCWLNCAAIEKWESREWKDRASHHSHLSTRWAQLHLPAICLAIALTAILAGAWSIHTGSSLAMILLDFACALSAGLFLVLDRSHLGAFHLRIAADVALLTPLVFAAVMW